MLELCQVSKRYGKVQALAPADLVTERSRTTVLIGSSGSGKSTLLRIMIGLIEPDSGEVRVDGQRLSSQNALELRHRMNINHIMWSTDYPHTGSDWPNSRVTIERVFRGVPKVEVKKMLHDNVKSLYRLDHIPDTLPG